MEGLDIPHLRGVVVPASSDGAVYLPIETFGRLYMQPTTAYGWKGYT